MISISFAYTDKNGAINLKNFSVNGLGNALDQIHDYLLPDIRNMVRYKCDATNALWGRDSNFDHVLQVVIHDMLNNHNEKI